MLKKEKKVVTKEIKVETPKVEDSKVEEPKVEVKSEKSVEVKKLPVYEHAQVVEILNDGRENPTEYHCKMSDGTTKHVPKSLFKL